MIYLHDIHIRNLKQALGHRLFSKKVHKVIKFNQNVSLKPYIDMITDLRKKAKNIEISNLLQQKEEETIWY